MNHAVVRCALVVLSLVSFPLLASEVVPLSVKETVHRANAIAVGVVTSKASRWGDASRRWMVTDYTLAVEETLLESRDSAIGKTITLTWWGGTIGQESQSVSDLRHPSIGERILVMLREDWNRAVGFSPVVGFNAGFFLVRSDSTIVDSAGSPIGFNTASLRATLPSLRSALPSAAVDAATSSTPPSPLPSARPELPGFPARRDRSDTALPLAPEAATPPQPRPQRIVAPIARSRSASIAAHAGVRTNYTVSFTAFAPIVMNQLPSGFTPWSPEDQYAMSFWNYYADVFRTYVSPTGTYGWQNNVFDVAGWPSSTDLENVYGVPWDSSTVATTFRRYDGNNRIIEADIAFNPEFSFTLDDEAIYDGGTSSKGFRHAVTHELGHVLGIEHNFNDLAAMNNFTNQYRFFGFPYMDDAEAIRAGYPANAQSREDLAVYLYRAIGSQDATEALFGGSVSSGGTITVSHYLVENAGTTTIATPTIEWYLTAQRNFGAAYYYLGTSTYPALAPFQYFFPDTVHRTFTVPTDVPAGQYYLAANIPSGDGPSHVVFPFGNNYAFTRTKLQVTACTPLPPTAVTATAQTTTSVAVSWNTAPCSSSYDVYRDAGNGYVPVGSSSTTNFTDTTAVAGKAYLYAIRTVAGAAQSSQSVHDLATTIFFTDPTLFAGSSLVKTTHIMELRNAVGAVRILGGMSGISYTNPTLTPGSSTMRAAHVSELRSALDAARADLSLSALSYTDPSLSTFTTKIKAVHIQQLRDGVR
jgi:hypothetical protein